MSAVAGGRPGPPPRPRPPPPGAGGGAPGPADAAADGLRRSAVERSPIRIDKEVSPDFLLVAKDIGTFTAMLGRLGDEFPVFALVRNPLAVLCSWQTVSFALHDGHAPIAEWLDPVLRRAIERAPGRVDRQLVLLSWFYERFSALPPERVIRYEEVVATDGGALHPIAPGAAGLRTPLRIRAPRGTPELQRELAGRLLATGGPWEAFYPRHDVAALAEAGTR